MLHGYLLPVTDIVHYFIFMKLAENDGDGNYYVCCFMSCVEVPRFLVITYWSFPLRSSLYTHMLMQ
jgi:hypothetical protein